MKWTKALIPVVILLPLAFVLAQGFGNDPHAVPFMLLGKPAPEIALETLEGEPFDLAAYRGKPVVLNFWSTWCEPCKLEHELLQDAARHYGDEAQFVGVVYQDTRENAVEYLAKRTNTYPQLMDPSSSTAIDYGISGVPESFFITADGKVQHKEAGLVNGPLIREQMAAMLGTSK